MKPTASIKPIDPAQNQETLALLEVLLLGNQQIEAGRVEPAAKAFAKTRKRKQP